VRQEPRDGTALAARRDLRLWLLAQPRALVLGMPPASGLCAGRYAAGGRPGDRPEREVALTLLPRALRGGETVIADKGYSDRAFAAAVAELGATLVCPAHADEPDAGPHLAPIRQRIESVVWTCKDLLGVERHGARTPRGLFVRIGVQLLRLAACISLNHQLGRPSRALADYTD